MLVAGFDGFILFFLLISNEQTILLYSGLVGCEKFIGPKKMLERDNYFQCSKRRYVVVNTTTKCGCNSLIHVH